MNQSLPAPSSQYPVPSLTFAIYNNEIYSNSHITDPSLPTNLYTRGYQVLLGLMQMKQYYSHLPNMIATIDGTVLDDYHSNNELGFYNHRHGNQSKRDLWVEHDYFGWGQAMIAPFPMYWKEMKATRLFDDWIQRENNIFWTGSVSENELRGTYMECVKRYPREITGDSLSFHHESIARDRILNRYFKRMDMDLRKLARHRYLIYIPGVEWSSSLKRIISAGAIPIIPRNNPHITMISSLLESKCPDCYLTYNMTSNINDFCFDLARIVNPKVVRNNAAYSDLHYEPIIELDSKLLDQRNLMARKLIAFVDDELSLSKVISNQYDVVTKLSKKQNQLNIQNLIHSKNLNEIACDELLFYMKFNAFEVDLNWQYDEWYDSNCTMRTDNPYLEYVAL